MKNIKGFHTRKKHFWVTRAPENESGGRITKSARDVFFEPE